MKTRSIGKKTTAGRAKIHAVKPPKPAKRTWTITLPQEIADIAEKQYQLVSKNAPGAIADRQAFIRGLTFAGIAAMNTTFGIIDQMFDVEEKHSGKMTPKRKCWMWEGAVSVMDASKMVSIMNKAPDGMVMTYKGEEIPFDKTPKSPALTVVSNKVTSIKRVKKTNADVPPDVA